MYTCNHLIHGNIKILHLHLRIAKRKANCEGDKFTPSFSVGDHKINEKKGEVVNGDKVYFGSDPKEEKIPYLKSPFELPKEVEDKPPLVECELGNLKEKNLMQTDGYSSEF